MHIGKRRLGSHNALLRTFPGADGLKTGFTCDSGYNVIASASRDGRRLLAVVLGETSGNERAIRSASFWNTASRTMTGSNSSTRQISTLCRSTLQPRVLRRYAIPLPPGAAALQSKVNPGRRLAIRDVSRRPPLPNPRRPQKRATRRAKVHLRSKVPRRPLRPSPRSGRRPRGRNRRKPFHLEARTRLRRVIRAAAS